MTNSLQLLLVLLPALGCATTYRTELVAQSSLSVVEPTAAATLEAELVIPAEKADAYLLAYEVRLPRAMELAYEIRCPEGTQSGVLGETFEAYRTRRLAELEQERRRQAELVGSLVGAVVPGVQAQGTATAPGLSAQGQATVRPGEVAEQAALQSMAAAALPPGDFGARTLRDEFELDGSAFGSCVFVLSSNVPGQDISGATVELALSRRIDVEAERAELAALEAELQWQAGLDLRADLAVDLEGHGAARRSLDERRQLGFELRAELAGDLIAGGADPGLQARLRAEAEAERQATEAERLRLAHDRAERERLELQARLEIEAQARARREAERQARARLEAELIGIAWEIRGGLSADLVALGADPGLRRRQIEEQARIAAADYERARLARAAELEAQLQVQRDAEVRFRLEFQAALDLRAGLSSDLVALGADPEFRRRQAEEQARRDAAERERREREAMFAEWTTEQQRLEADLRARRDQQAAADARAGLQVEVQATVDAPRPPRPAARQEVRPVAPAQGAIWVPGEWIWDGLAWVWAGGRWEVQAGLQAGGSAGTGSTTTWGLGGLGIGVDGSISIGTSPVTVEVRTERP